MKNKLYYLGLVSCLIVLMGCLFKINRIAGAGILLMLGILIPVLWFFPVAIINSYKGDEGPKHKTLYIVAYICILANFAGALFMLMHWPGSRVMSIIGIVLSIIVFLPIYLFYNRKDDQINYSNLMGVVFLIAFNTVITSLLSLNVSKNVIDDSLITTDRLKENQEITMAQIELIAGNEKDSPTLKAIQDKSFELNSVVDSLKAEIIKSVRFYDEKSTGTDWFVINDSNGKRLKKEIKHYQSFLVSELPPNYNETANYINSLLNTADVNGHSWEYRCFNNKNMINTIVTLDLLKRNITLAELEAIKAVAETKSAVVITK